MSDPSKCEKDIYENGQMVAMIAGPRSATIEDWVTGVREASGQRVDWHFAGGRAIVLAIGDLPRVAATIRERRELLVDMCTNATNNWSKNPSRDHVMMNVYDHRDGVTWRDEVPHVVEAADGSRVLVEPSLP